MKNGSKNKILYVLTKPSKFNTPSFLIQNLELTMHSLLLSSSQSSIQKPSMTPYLCGCIYRRDFQSPLIPRTLHLFNPISHYRPSQIFNWKTQNPFTQNCYGSYIFLKKLQLIISVNSREEYMKQFGEREIEWKGKLAKAFPIPKYLLQCQFSQQQTFSLFILPPSHPIYPSSIPLPPPTFSLSLSLFALYYFQKFHQLQVTLS